ncbi:MAG: hypothetical protein J3T61_03280, partial [Candidatus Brocadiales bacterium]|nr:hypothetical protein [Candidatus Bathyanammoxibius sp.]
MPEHSRNDGTERPDAKSIKTHHAYLEELWSPGITAMKEADLYFTLSDNIWEEWEKENPDDKGIRPNYHDGRASAFIRQAVDAHMALEPQFTRTPVGGSEESKEKADRLEKGLQAVVSDAFTKDMNFPTKVNGIQITLHTYTQAFVGLDEGALNRPGTPSNPRMTGEDNEDFEAREWTWRTKYQTWNPITIEVPEPGSVLMDPTQKVPDIAIRRKTMKAYRLHNLTVAKAAKQDGVKIFELVGKDPY